jgi:hypothetical protein
MTIGALTAILVAPTLLFVVAFLCRSETGENTRPITIKRPFSVGALVATGLLGVALAIWPAEIGARLGTIGVLDAGLALASSASAGWWRSTSGPSRSRWTGSTAPGSAPSSFRPSPSSLSRCW